jgi:hypothetical protein
MEGSGAGAGSIQINYGSGYGSRGSKNRWNTGWKCRIFKQNPLSGKKSRCGPSNGSGIPLWFAFRLKQFLLLSRDQETEGDGRILWILDSGTAASRPRVTVAALHLLKRQFCEIGFSTIRKFVFRMILVRDFALIPQVPILITLLAFVTS